MQIPDNVTPLDQTRSDQDRAWNEKKKERTRTLLTDAAIRLMATRGIDAVTVNDIAVEASLAPGTFYNYFPSLDALQEELVQFVIENIETISGRRTLARDPGSRLARVLRGHLKRAADEPNEGRLLVQFVNRMQPAIRAALVRGLADDIHEGIGKGQFSAEADQAAPDLVVGALLAGIQRVAEGNVQKDYHHHLTANILRGLGMVSAAALDRVQRGI